MSESLVVTQATAVTAATIPATILLPVTVATAERAGMHTEAVSSSTLKADPQSQTVLLLTARLRVVMVETPATVVTQVVPGAMVATEVMVVITAEPTAEVYTSPAMSLLLYPIVASSTARQLPVTQAMVAIMVMEI